MATVINSLKDYFNRDFVAITEIRAATYIFTFPVDKRAAKLSHETTKEDTAIN